MKTRIQCDAIDVARTGVTATTRSGRYTATSSVVGEGEHLNCLPGSQLAAQRSSDVVAVGTTARRKVEWRFRVETAGAPRTGRITFTTTGT